MTLPFPSAKAPTGRAEFGLLLGVPLCYIAVLQFFVYSPDTVRSFSNLRFLRLLAFEVLFGLPALLLLMRRGWRWPSISHPWEARDLLRGLGVWILGYLVTAIGWLIAYVSWPALVDAVAADPFTSTASTIVVLLLALVNPVFEECLWLGYLLNGPGQQHPRTVLLLSIAARTFAHSYQGWSAVFAILPLGLWFTRYYWRTGRLWPVIIAHALFDAVGLLAAGFQNVAG